ncbi:bifunctional phosphatase PAP2/diacylglycerol kinase family protein [Streptomyces sp. NPDC001380]|uniref:bifunctional phosphatase PAP2/diacylglycerol kinase family protein n=1 Tax=Streptomyces sp. NPDC001380 TaxID=3364566 RepID=UPI003695212F
MQRISEFDRRLFERVAAARLRGAHPVLPRLSRAADHGVLWMGAAAALGVVGTRSARRAALRGIGSLAVASLATNTAAKWAARRTRPGIGPVPLMRRLSRQPLSSSFPSGHSASAVAFATAVALEAPRYGAVLAPVAAAVAASRVYVGVHYPGDVLAGCALGMGAAALTTRWWPLRPESPAEARVRTSAPALPGGEGLVAVVNDRAGLGTSDPAADLPARLRALLPAAEIVPCGPDDDLAELLEKAARRAAELGGALGVCGGDGSVNAAAVTAARAGLPLAVFPGGTLNHFALDLGIDGLQACADAVCAGEAVSVDLGLVRAAGPDGGPETERARFLNTFSIGVYPDLVRAREQLENRLGKWPAVAVGLVRVLRTAEPLRVEVNGSPRRLWLLFAGNGVYRPDGFAPTYRDRLDDGLLDIRTVDGSTPFARTRLIAAVLTGTLGRSRVYGAARLHRLRLSGLEDVGHMAFDGEVAPAPDALLLDKQRQALTVYRPAD